MKSRDIFLVSLLGAAFLLAVTAASGQDRFRLKPGAEGKLCVQCHVAFRDTLKRPFVHTPVRSGNCAGCHNPHASSHGKLLESDTGKLCLKCHGGIVPGKARSTHKVVAEGDCVKCHDPHAADHKANLRKEGNALCNDCHKDVADNVAAAKFRHRPVGEGCLNCHEPHSSGAAASLMKESVPGLCARCHETNKPAFRKQHMNYPVAGSRCVLCHNAHGSNRAGVLYDNVHAPVANKMCSQCHEEPDSSSPFRTKRAGIDLCRGCHSDMVNGIYDKSRIHWPVVGKEGCQSCHNPHASTRKGLLQGTMAGVCGKCHADTLERQARSAAKHPPVAEGNCTACHDPHASNAVFLFNRPNVVDLCATCHEWQKHSTHPIGEKVADPRNRNLTLQCLSCHRSHGTEFRKLIPFATVSELCTQCHVQFKR